MKRLLLAVLILAWCMPGKGQYLVNKNFQTPLGSPINSDAGAMLEDGNGNVYIVGNKDVTNQGSNVYLAKLNAAGAIQWESNYDHGNQMDEIGIDLKMDSNGDLIVLASTTTDNAIIPLLLKYDSDGVRIWKEVIPEDGAFVYEPVNLVLNSSDQAYFTTQRTGSKGGIDITVHQIDNNGVFQWSSVYDYGGGRDLPTKVLLDGSGNVVVGGLCEDEFGEAALTTLELNPSTGVLMEDYHYTSLLFTFEKPQAMVMDGSSNVYLMGTADNGQDDDLYLLKANSNATFAWFRSYNNGGADDGGLDMVFNTKLYLSGYKGVTGGNSEFLTLCFSTAGALVWTDSHVAQEISGNAAAYRLAVTPTGELMVAGGVEGSTSREMIVAMYDANAAKIYEEHFLLPGFANYEIVDLMPGADDKVLGTFLVDNGSTSEYIGLSVTYFHQPSDVVVDANGDALYMDHEILVNFDPSVINTTTVDNTDILFGSYGDFLDATTIASIEEELNFETEDYKVRKVFRKLTTQITHSTTRGGQTVEIPKFWSTLLLSIPFSQDPLTASQNILAVKKVVDAEVNAIGSADAIVPNDATYNVEQISLQSNDPGGIDAEGAWTFTKGSDQIKVGVYDSGIDWRHEDFGDGTFAGSKIAGGWDWYNNVHVSSQANPAFDDHGTACAGIIGALRNNGLGVAGIAGGDVDDDSNTGVELFSMRMDKSATQLSSMSTVADAIVEGASWAPPYGYGLHVMNHSWSILSYSTILRNAVEYSSQNEVVFCASRGNSGSLDPRYPSCYFDDWALNCGSSDQLGEYHDGTNGSGSGSTSYGLAMDFIAPGVNEIVHTTDFASTNAYMPFSGTSSAAPHVAGISSLLLSYYNDNNTGAYLAPEDVEHLIQMSCIDRTLKAGEGLGYDHRSGWGFVQAGAALEAIEKNIFDVEHQSLAQNGYTSLTNTVIFSNVQRNLPTGYQNLVAGNYYMDVHLITVDIPHSIAPGKMRLDQWVRNSSSNLWRGNNPMAPYGNLNMTFIDNTHATFSGFTYFVRSGVSGQINQWIPFDASQAATQARVAYSIYTEQLPLDAKEPIEMNFGLEVFPNPTSSDITLRFDLEKASHLSVEITDVHGRVLENIEIGKRAVGSHTANLGMSHLAPGVYFCTVSDGSTTSTQKVIKTN